MNNFDKYYTDQAGNGIAGFSGVKYQKGFGFFGRLLSGAVLPFLRFMGKNVLNAGANIANDLVDSDDFSINNIKEVGKKRLQEKSKEMLKKGAEKILSGNGLRKYRRKKVIKVKKAKKSKKQVNKRRRVSKKSNKKRKKRSIRAKDFLN